MGDAGLQKLVVERVFRSLGLVFFRMILGGAVEFQEKKDDLLNFISILNISREKCLFPANLPLMPLYHNVNIC